MSPTTPSPRHPHVFAVNHAPAVLALMRDLLREEGFCVSTRTYVERDLAGIAALTPEVIVLDAMWPGEDGGWATLQLLRMHRETARIPVVLCTGAVREVEGLAGHLEEAGVRVVLKPYTIDRLVEAVRGALAPAGAAG